MNNNEWKWIKGENYLVIPELPLEQQKPLNEWLAGQSCPLIEGEGNCCYPWDYENWLKYWKRINEINN